MSEIREQIVWKVAFFDSNSFGLTKFLETINEESSKIPDQFKNDSFIRFSSDQKDEYETICEIEIGYNRPETEEEKAINDKLEEENEKRRYNRLKADFERLKAKFEKT